jgi:hypothetical protein
VQDSSHCSPYSSIIAAFTRLVDCSISLIGMTNALARVSDLGRGWAVAVSRDSSVRATAGELDSTKAKKALMMLC